MSNLEIIILSVALAIDAMLVSFSYGLIIDENKIKNAFLLAIAFGLFQFFMPILGCFLTSIFYSQLILWSKWIVFCIFMFLGLKFLKSAFEKKEQIKIICISFSCLICLAVATSIDALGAGVSFKLLNIEPFYPSIMIGMITFLLSLFGFYVASAFKKFPSRYAELFGALLLVYLSIKAILF